MTYKERLLIIIGTAVISLIFWDRFLSKREDYQFNALEVIIFKLIAITLVRLMFLILLMKTLYLLTYQKTQNKYMAQLLELHWVKKIQEFMYITMIEAPSKVYERIYMWKIFPVHF